MGTVLGYIIALLVVGGVLFLVASYAFGRGEEMAPVLPEGTPLELPDGRLAGGDDLRALRLSVALRGYRMDEVDWLLERLSEQVDSRDREIARLRSVLHVEPVEQPVDEPELLTHPFPAVRDADPTGPRALPDEYRDTEAPGPRAVPDEARYRDTGARPGVPARDLRMHDEDDPGGDPGRAESE